MDYKKMYEEWLTNPYFDAETKKELESIKDDEGILRKRFGDDI